MATNDGEYPFELPPGRTLFRRLESPEARELRELTLMHSDLDYALAAVSVVRQINDGKVDTPYNEVMRRSLLSDAIVQFCACFGKTEPFKLDLDTVFKDSKGDWRSFYNDVLAKRDSYVAHRFGSERQCEIAVAVNVEPGTPPIIATSKFQWAGYEEHDVIQLGNAIIAAQMHVQGRMSALEEALKAQVAAMSEEELASLPLCVFTGPEGRTSRERARGTPR